MKYEIWILGGAGAREGCCSKINVTASPALMCVCVVGAYVIHYCMMVRYNHVLNNSIKRYVKCSVYFTENKQNCTRSNACITWLTGGRLHGSMVGAFRRRQLIILHEVNKYSVIDGINQHVPNVIIDDTYVSTITSARQHGGHDCVLILPTPRLFDTPARGNPLEFLDETYLAKTRGMGLPYSENFIILTSTVFLWYTRVTDGQTDGRAIACSALSIHCGP